MLKNIKDPVHGYIDINDQDIFILNTKFLERLRYIHHLGTGFLIYPGATHSRFEHSLGVMHLGTKIFDSLVRYHPEFWEERKEKICCKNQTRRNCKTGFTGRYEIAHDRKGTSDYWQHTNNN